MLAFEVFGGADDVYWGTGENVLMVAFECFDGAENVCWSSARKVVVVVLSWVGSGEGGEEDRSCEDGDGEMHFGLVVDEL